MLCAVALMGGQNHVAIGTEWLIASSGACAVYVYGYLRARSAGGSPTTLSLLRTITGTTFYAALIAGSVVLLAGATGRAVHRGLAMVTIGVYSVSGAWLLLVGAYGDERERSPH